METIILSSILSEDGTLTFELSERKSNVKPSYRKAEESKRALTSLINFQHQRFLINQGRIVDKNLLGQEFRLKN